MGTFGTLGGGSQFNLGPPGSFAQLLFNDNPQAALQYGLGQAGYGLGQSQAPEARYAQDNYARILQNYYAQRPFRGPNWSFTDYLPEALGQIGTEFRGLAPSQRGENPGLFGGRVRFL